MQTNDPVLAKYRAAVTALYGDRIERIVLYGSRARGDARPDSDYDVAIFLKDLGSRLQEGRPLADIELAIMDETGAIVSALLYPAGHWKDAVSPLMSEIRKDGLDL